jgi:hypothetical protein
MNMPESIDQMLTMHDLTVRELGEIKTEITDLKERVAGLEAQFYGRMDRLESTLNEIAFGLGVQPK